ncbi:27 kDa hemolymph protein-like [Eupeodes corollae]|uniref:27 kDa hemolymph protein-like n=1 Tax=Eupeodes corollae TaxID=290404 RepID=UPI00248F79FD|nr:27 kDa hemolymph protein-like [Eupeodes corollae]
MAIKLMRISSLSQLLLITIISLGILGAAVYATDSSAVNIDELKNQIPPELANGNLTDKAKNLFKDKCRKIAGNDTGDEAFASLEQGIATAIECVTGIVNMSAIQMEIESARPTGDLDVVFNKYCKKRPDALGCLQNLVHKFEPCLEQDERNNTDVLMHIFESLLNFVCHKGGDQIALFIAERGPECLESKKEQIQRCMNSTFGEYVPKDSVENIETLPKFIIGPKQCDDIQNLSDCVTKELEKCEEITPANIVESMFRFIKNATICRNEVSTAHQKSNVSSSSSTLSGVLTLLLAAVAISIATTTQRRT